MKINLYFRKNIDDDEELKDDRLEKRTREHFKSIIHNSFRNQWTESNFFRSFNHAYLYWFSFK